MRPESAAAAIENGLKAAKDQLSIRPETAEALALEGMFYCMQSKIDATEAQRKQEIQRAEETLSRAFQINQLLKRHYQSCN